MSDCKEWCGVLRVLPTSETIGRAYCTCGADNYNAKKAALEERIRKVVQPSGAK